VTRPLLINIQLLRFFAAAAVLVGHAGDLFIPDNAAWRTIPWSGGVDIFFVISGFVMTYLTQGQFGASGASKAFLIRRIIRIVPPYWLFTTLMIAAVLLFREHVRNTSVNGTSVFASYFFIPWPRTDGELNPLLSQGWTLNYEAFFYAAFAVALFLRRGLTWLAAAFLVMAIAYVQIPASLFVLKFWANPIILEFLGGVALGLIFLRGIRLPLWASAVLVGFAVAIFLLSEPIAAGAFRRLLHVGIPALMLCASLALAPEPANIGPIRRALVLGGDSSYTLYLSHTFSLNAAVIAWQKSGFGTPAAAMLAAVCIAVLAAVLIYRLIERRMTDALHQLTGTKRARGVAAVAP
jgi:exopolysaccharide production protein ExoZ